MYECCCWFVVVGVGVWFGFVFGVCVVLLSVVFVVVGLCLVLLRHA